MGDEEWAMAFS